MNSTDNLNTKQTEYKGLVINGFVALFVLLIFLCILAGIADCDFVLYPEITIPILIVGAIIFITLLGGFFVQDPNIARVVSFAGVYKGTFSRNGFFWINPFMSKRKNISSDS